MIHMKSRSPLWHPNTQMSEWTSFPEIVSAKGMWLYDSKGGKMLDGVASMWCNVWGHSGIFGGLLRRISTPGARMKSTIS